MGHPFRSSGGVLSSRNRLPADRRLPLVYRLLDVRRQEAPADPLARTPKLALLEAALMLADEPLPVRKLAQVAALADGREARQLVQRLQGLYDQEGSSFQVEELAGGFQL